MPPGDHTSDASRPVATSRDSRYSLTIEDAADLYEKSGHPRTLRTIQRYCASGHLDSIKVATTLGDKYFIDPASLSRHVAQIEELAQVDFHATGRDLSRPAATEEIQDSTGDIPRHDHATGHDMSPPVAASTHTETAQPMDDIVRQGTTNDDKPRHVEANDDPMSPPAASDTLDVSRYVAGLEREVERLLEDRQFDRDQIRTKDKQIESLLERDRETNYLIRGLQDMIPRLAGPRTPEPPSTQHEA